MKPKIFCRIIISAFILALLFTTPITASANEKETIRVGYYSAYTDVIEDINSLNNKGYGHDVFKKMEELSDFQFEFVPIDGSLIDALNNDVVDVAGFSIRTDARREEVIFSENPYGKTYVALMTEDMDITYNSPESIDGKTVATYEDNIGQTYLDVYCEWNDISVEYIYAETHNYMTTEADFYITYSEERMSEEYNSVLNLGVFNLYLMTSLENQELMSQLDTVFYQMVATEGNFFLELEEKYLAKNIEINHRGITQNEINILNQRPLEVAYISDYNPISFTNEQGEADGAMVDTLNLFAENYGFEVNYHPYSIYDDKSAIDGYDMVLTLYGEGDYIFENYNLTESYYSIPMYAQIDFDVFKDSEDMNDILEKSPRIGTLIYQTVDFNNFLEIYPNNEFVYYKDWHGLLDDFNDGKIDMMVSTQSAVPYIEIYLADKEKATINTDLEIPMHFYISKDISDVYMPIFNIMLDRVSEDEYAAILSTNSSQNYPDDDTTFLEFVREFWYYYALGALVIAFSFVVFIFIAKQRKKNALLQAYNTDSLTGFMAIHKFRETMEETLEKAQPKEYELFSLDIDMFKTINTHYSNEKGTAVIQAVADAFKTAFAETSAVICRKTADQFLVFRKVGDGGSMQQIYTDNILPNLTEILGEKYRVHMSFGSAIITNCQEKSTAIIGYADTARQHGKSQNKTTFVTFDDAMKKFYKNKIEITFRMEQALKDREFYVVFQPKVNFDTLKVGGAEALVRWKPKLGQTIFPDAFIPVFEQNGFISALDLYVLEETCKFIVTNSAKMDIPRISVNLSALTVTSDNIVSKVSDILEKYSIDPSEIELELTESAIDNAAETFLLRVKQFKALGLLISIDDFGAGVSSLNRLAAIDADILKLDKAFFDLKDQGGKSSVVVENVVKMAKELNMLVVAEGVETYAQALWLKSINCDYAQGYYFAKPILQDEFKELILSKKQYQISK